MMKEAAEVKNEHTKKLTTPVVVTMLESSMMSEVLIV